ncbi:MAG: hypothetical protein ACFFDT_33040 [Candidatus Hodarchaeota archaeon]
MLLILSWCALIEINFKESSVCPAATTDFAILDKAIIAAPNVGSK